MFLFLLKKSLGWGEALPSFHVKSRQKVSFMIKFYIEETNQNQDIRSTIYFFLS